MQFNSIPGQEEIKSHLIEEVKGGKISHAQLFAGKSGHATLPMALAFVQYIFCENKQEKDSCGTCPSCKKVSDLQHPDLHFSFPTVQTISKQPIRFCRFGEHKSRNNRSLICTIGRSAWTTRNGNRSSGRRKASKS